MVRRIPQFNALRAFETSARCLSFTKAAGELNVSTSAVSQQVRQLEEQLGVQLVDRLVTGLALTDEGRALLPYVRKAFAHLDEGLARLDSPDLPRSLKLLVLSSFALKWLGPRLGQFANANPTIEVSMFNHHEPPDFGSTDFDIAILWGEGDWPGCDSYFLMGERIFPVCAPSIAQSLDESSPEQLTAFTILTTPTFSEWPLWARSVGLKTNEFAGSLIFDNAAMVIDAAIDGQGVALARSGLAHDAIKDGSLVRPFAQVLESPNAYYMLLPSEKSIGPAVEIFMDWAAECARECIREQDALYALSAEQLIASGPMTSDLRQDALSETE